ncbi:MAG: hypothetical protein U0269_06835 [Polyangiales bacterium]
MKTDARDARHRSFSAILFLCALVPASLAALVATRDTEAQRAPLLVLTVQPRPGMDGRRAELRIDDNGSYTSDTRIGRLTAAQLRQLRAERARVRWRMAPSAPHCEAIPMYEHRVQSLGQAVAWSSPCAPLPDPTVLRFVERAQAMVRAAPGRTIEPSVPAMDAGAAPTAQDASAAVVARDASVAVADARASDPRACTGPGQCVLACPEVQGCCGFPCGCTQAIHRDHLAAFTAEYARTCRRAPRCEPVGCAYQMRSASCVNGRCVAVSEPGL